MNRTSPTVQVYPDMGKLRKTISPSQNTGKRRRERFSKRWLPDYLHEDVDRSVKNIVYNIRVSYYEVGYN